MRGRAMGNQDYDFIIVGAGSAGCALAARLTREASHRVLLLEAGPRDRHPMVSVPLGFAMLMKHPKLNWCYETEPEPHMNGRRMAWPRGKLLGGSSAINGMVYIRGQREDYDGWAANGCPGWAWEDVLPWFLRSEHNVNGASEWHGTGGPLWVDNPVNRYPLTELYIQACVEEGIPYNDDFNGPRQEGVGYYQLNIRRGRRQSAAHCFLAPCRQRPNLHLVTEALAERVLFEGRRATGVRYRRPDGSTVEARARGEVILCGGTVNSPQLLELSGIGQSERLQTLGIPVVHEAPEVGENLQDHLTVNVQQGFHGLTTFYEETRPLAMARNLFHYLTRGRGLLAHPAAEVGVFFRTSEEVERPDAQIHFAPAAGEYNERGTMVTVPGTTATVCLLRPTSRGWIHLGSADPARPPVIRANYLATDHDRQGIVAAIRRTRAIYQAPSLAPYRTEEIRPGRHRQTDEELLEFAREIGESVYHPVGTCRMGSDEGAVVAPDFKVHGVEGLRVADASIMPTILSGNTHAACVLFGERCGEMILTERRRRSRSVLQPRTIRESA